ncbi:hypothetical protein [Glutamicibacter soli]
MNKTKALALPLVALLLSATACAGTTPAEESSLPPLSESPTASSTESASPTKPATPLLNTAPTSKKNAEELVVDLLKQYEEDVAKVYSKGWKDFDYLLKYGNVGNEADLNAKSASENGYYTKGVSKFKVISVDAIDHSHYGKFSQVNIDTCYDTKSTQAYGPDDKPAALSEKTKDRYLRHTGIFFWDKDKGSWSYFSDSGTGEPCKF